MNKNICIQRLCKYGDYEIACGHMVFSIEFIVELYDIYISKN